MTLEEAMNTGWGLLIRLCLAAKKFQIDRLKNDSIDAMTQEKEIDYLPIWLISHMYENKLPESRLQRLMLDTVRSEIPREKFYEYKHEMPRKLLEDLAKASYGYEDSPYDRYTRETRSPDVDFCSRYHQHANKAATCTKLKNVDRMRLK
jgi:hypothetical protein